MKTKRYWLRGLVVGVILYMLLIIGFTFWPGVTSDIGTKGTAQVTAVILIPLPILGLIIGWIYGKIQSRKQIGMTIK